MRLFIASLGVGAVVFAWAGGLKDAAHLSCMGVCRPGDLNCVEACECTVSNCYFECSKDQPDQACSQCSLKACQTELNHLTNEIK